mmetsp:Transcript_28369/g.50529  ORF Transcript_28369/g.50529 Transcript_28369/m.50529 type:complete len:301 (+) Transcript_28369:37-939(+)
MGMCNSANVCSTEICCKDRLDTERLIVKPKSGGGEGFDITNSQRQTTILEDNFLRKDCKELHCELEVISSSCLEQGSVFVITPYGLPNSFRSPKDSTTYFGCKKRSKLPDGQKGPIVNDIVFPLEDDNLAEMHRGRHFQITYDQKSESYSLLDLGLGFGCYLKLTQPITLMDEQLLQVGKVFIVLKLVRSPDNILPRLEVRVYGSSNSSINFCFPPIPERQSLTIGRLPENDIPILDDDLLSKKQCTLFWTKSNWLLTDGDLEQPSTNGTWIYVNRQWPLLEGDLIKASNTLFRVSLKSL